MTQLRWASVLAATLIAMPLVGIGGCEGSDRADVESAPRGLLEDEWGFAERWVEAFGQVSSHDPLVEGSHRIFERLRPYFDGKGRRLIVLGSDLAIVEAPLDVFAAALPDGSVVVSRAALELCYAQGTIDEGDARVAFLLAHELVHLQNDHNWFLEAEALVMAFQGEDEIVASLRETLGSDETEVRKLEVQADQDGILGMAMAGYDPMVILGENESFFDSWVGSISNQIAYSDGTHPTPAERSLYIRSQLRRASGKISLFHRGLDAMNAEDYTAAIDAFEELKLTFDSREVLSDLGLAYYQLAARQLAACDGVLVTTWRMPVEIDEETLLERVTWRGNEKSHCYTEEPYATTFRRAKEALEGAYDREAAYAPAILNLAALYLLNGDGEFAIAYARQGLEVHPGHVDLEIALATAEAATQLDLGRDLGEAADRLEALHRLHPEVPVLAFNAAQALTLAGSFERAEPIWRAFLELEPEGEWAEIARWKVGDDGELPGDSDRLTK